MLIEPRTRSLPAEEDAVAMVDWMWCVIWERCRGRTGLVHVLSAEPDRGQRSPHTANRSIAHR